jgi:hypothetical protein
VKAGADKILVILVLLSFSAILPRTAVLQGFSITKDEAIEISRNSSLVWNLLANADKYSVEASYMNKTEVTEALSEFPGLREEYPENRSIWVVTWAIHPKGAVSAFSFLVAHVIDDETGKILHESTVGLR